MSSLTLLNHISVAIFGAAACCRAVAPSAARGAPSPVFVAALGVALPRSSALSLGLARAVEKARREQPLRAEAHANGTLTASQDSKTLAGASQIAAAEGAALPGIAGAPPPPSGIAQLLPSRALLSLHVLPGWCREDGTEPRTSSLRARGFARLARRPFDEEEVVAQPADPIEWACTHTWSAWFLYAIVIWAVGTMVTFVFASLFYWNRVPKYDNRASLNPEETFLSGHFGCLSDSPTCLMAFLCPAVRWADTVHMAGLLSFWCAFWILAVCYLPSLAFFVLWGLFPLVPLVTARQQLRGKLGLPAGNETWVSDCCFASFCSCCLIAQEARVVNEAYIVGHTAMPISGGRAD